MSLEPRLNPLLVVKIQYLMAEEEKIKFDIGFKMLIAKIGQGKEFYNIKLLNFVLKQLLSIISYHINTKAGMHEIQHHETLLFKGPN